MRWLVLLSLAVSACQAQIVFPDEWERLKEEEQQNKGGGLVLPPFEKPDGSQSNVNVIQGSENPDNNGVQSFAPESQSWEASRATSNESFATFLPPKWRDHVLNIISRGTTQFTLDLDRAIDKPSLPLSNENVLFSPASVTVTLAMVMLASAGKTFDEVSKILGLESGVDISGHSEIVHQIFGLLTQEANKKNLQNPSSPQTKFAFGVFVQDGYPIRKEFRAVSEKVYHSDVINVDFSQHNREAQDVVNKWVNDRTNGKITNMLSEPPSPLTDIIIASALYFSGEWAQYFFEGTTKRKPFNIEPDQTVYVDMMANGGDFPFYEDKELGLDIIGLPYKGNEVTMYAVTPHKPGRAALRDLKGRLTPEAVDGLIARMAIRQCIITFPRMKLSSTLKLRGALEALGLSSLFDPQTADLSVLSPGRGAGRRRRSARGQTRPGYFNYTTDGYDVEIWPNGYSIKQSRPVDESFVEFLKTQDLTNFGVDDLRNGGRLRNPGLYADAVLHRVEMTVDEKGTEAAAATSVSLDRGGDLRTFRGNRPFLFFIRHDPTKTIWFWGTINRPTPFYNTPQ